MDKKRELFEAHCRKIGYELKRYDDESGDYFIGFGGEAWRWWQAAIASVFVELPSDKPLHIRREITNCLVVAGIKCK